MTWRAMSDTFRLKKSTLLEIVKNVVRMLKDKVDDLKALFSERKDPHLQFPCSAFDHVTLSVDVFPILVVCPRRLRRLLYSGKYKMYVVKVQVSNNNKASPAHYSGPIPGCISDLHIYLQNHPPLAQMKKF
eukprot:TRINITY_DN1845_c0_g1_i1.p1 TRINITY_DN1845_c0_g1~~TRINITY_DN1845_c0_g1_i1.p1  ORF type:complete len:131 (+),score=8.44 TRINITY_DN1845_c0_g1_i1:144-536(+)